MNIQLHLKGFLHDEEVEGRKSFSEIGSKFDGKKLTDLYVTSLLTCREDFDFLINTLKIHKECFTK